MGGNGFPKASTYLAETINDRNVGFGCSRWWIFGFFVVAAAAAVVVVVVVDVVVVVVFFFGGGIWEGGMRMVGKRRYTDKSNLRILDQIASI